MKRILVLMLLCIAPFLAFSQKNTDTASITVSGNCGMCKNRIERAAYGKGVHHAVWNKQTGILSITFHSGKTSADEVARRVAAAGHHAGDHKAVDAAYQKLPACCQYQTNPSTH